MNGFARAISSSSNCTVRPVWFPVPARRINISIFRDARALVGKQIPDLDTAFGCIETNSNENASEPLTSFTT
jgi:hypothetical protein